MEFVLVTFPTLRRVRMDGAQQGETGQVIGVQRGTHIFDLGNPSNYAPPSVQTVVANTSQMQPLVIPFEPAMLPVSVGGPPPRGPVTAGAAPKRPPARRATRAKKVAHRKSSAARKKAAPAKKKSTRKQSGKQRGRRKKGSA